MRTLEQCEVAIQKGFAEAGQAFKEIRDNRLYKDKYRRFEDYCKEVHQLGRHAVNKLIAASNVIENLVTNGHQNRLPTSERVARELTSLPPDAQSTVWQAATETAPNNTPIAKHVASIKEIFEKNKRDMEHPDVANLIKLVQSPEKINALEEDTKKRVEELKKVREIRKKQDKSPLSAKLRKIYIKDLQEYWEHIDEVRTEREQLDIARLYIDFLLTKYPMLHSELTLHVVEEVG